MQRMPTTIQCSSLKENKRGDIPITILVIGIIAICILTLVSFLFSRLIISESFVGAGLIETIYSFEEEQNIEIQSFQKSTEKGVYSVKIIFDEASGKFHGEYNHIYGYFNKKEKNLIYIEYKPVE